jgi:hypothetical protein
VTVRDFLLVFFAILLYQGWIRMNARGLRLLLLCFWLAARFIVVWSAEKNSNSPLLEIRHVPEQPRAGEAVTISAKLNGPAKGVTLEYQIVEPGDYITFNDPRYRSNWQALSMEKAAVTDSEFKVQVPGAVQTHRRLIRYRLKVTGTDGKSLSVPTAGDAEPNFAYFVFNGLPPWRGAIQPRSGDPRRSEAVEFGTNVMGQVQTYFLFGKAREIESATWYEQSYEKEYKYTGTFVAGGKVYDHIRYRNRGGVWRYAMGKNMWKIDFNKGHKFQARDDYGQKYKSKWAKLNLRSCIQQGDYGRRGEQGMYESVGFRLFNLAGVDAPKTHWITLRIVDGKDETPADQYKGDFWGLYLAIENEDGHFLEEHGLPDGNLYKMMFGQGELSNQGAGQVTNRSDIARFMGSLNRRNLADSWWRTNVNLSLYYSYRSIVEAIHHYDISDGKNYDFYLNPKTGQWHVIPWDIDLTWGDHMYGGGVDPFKRPILSRPAFLLEYQNRLREIRDLLFNPDETGRLIDECAAIISRPRGIPSIVDADRAKWDYHPIMVSRYAQRDKAGQGLFYTASRTGDFAGMVRQMKNYVKTRCDYIDRSLINDPTIPSVPTVTYTGKPGFPPNDLSFTSSEFNSPDKTSKFGALKWRIGEIDLPQKFSDNPKQSGHYEITSVWESPELDQFKESMTIPTEVVKAGHTYRIRARMKDQAGRWSHWSAPIQFTVGQ